MFAYALMLIETERKSKKRVAQNQDKALSGGKLRR
jgi:hypothetical protein